MSDLIPIADEDFLDTLAWSLQHRAQSIRSLLMRSTSLDTCRYLAARQLEHLQRAGVLMYRRERSNFGQFRAGPKGEGD
jgi:hypothetical protein